MDGGAPARYRKANATPDPDSMPRLLLPRLALLLAAFVVVPIARAQSAATHTKAIWGVAFSADERFVATASSAELRLWSLPDGALACRLDGAYWGADAVADGGSSFLVTVNDYVMTGGGRKVPQRAFRVDAATCAQTPVALGTAPSGPVTLVPAVASPGQRVTLAGGRVVAGSFRVAAIATPTATYTCAADSRPVRNRSYSAYRTTYERVTSGGRPERLAQMDEAGCGTLALTPDGRFLTDTSGGIVIDLRRKRLTLKPDLWTATTIGIDAAGERAAVGFKGGYTVYDLGSGRQREAVRSDGTDYVSPTLRFVAFASGFLERPLVQVQPVGGQMISLDDARSRAGADATVAAREAEVQARADGIRRLREAEAAESARNRAASEARVASLRSLVENAIGPVSVSTTLRQIQYQGAYDWIVVDLKRGDTVVLATLAAQTATFTITDPGRGIEISLPPDPTPFRVDGYAIVRTRMDQDVSGNLFVRSDGLPVHVFVVPAANRR